MQELIITASQSQIYDRLEANTHYKAVKDTADSGAYERIAITQYNQEIFNLWLPTAMTSLAIAASHYLKKPANISNGGYTVTLAMTDNWDKSLEGTCNDAALSYITARLIAEWYKIVQPDSVEIVQQEALSLLSEFVDLLHHRKRPSLPDYYTPNTSPSDDQSQSIDHESTDNGPAPRPTFDNEEE